MVTTPEDLPSDIAALRAALLAERAKRIEGEARTARVEAELAVAKAKASDDQALIAHQQLQLAKLTRELYGQRSERRVQLLDQMALAFEELESSASEDEITAEQAVAKTTNVVAFIRKRPARQPVPEHLPRERVVEPGPATCQCCGSPRLRKLGEDITETLETIPADDGRICLSNNAAERALRGIALGRKSWLFAGSDRGGQRAAAMYSLIVTAKLNDIDPQAWLVDILARIAEHPFSKIDELLPWNWRPRSAAA